MKTETIKKRKTESLLKYINDLDEKYYNAITRSTGIDFGYGMRAYTRLKHQAFPEDKIRANFQNVVQELRERNIEPCIIRKDIVYLKPYLNN